MLQDNSLNFIDKIHKEFQKKIINEFGIAVLDNGEDYIFTTEKKIYTATTTKNQKNHLNEDVTTIDLGGCEDKLKQIYNISKNASLYIL